MSSAATATAMNAAVVPDEPVPRGKGKLVVILIAVLALVAGGAGGAAWYFHQKAEATTEAKDDKGAEAKPAKKAEVAKPPVFNTLENFTVNLAGSDHFMQLGIVLQLKDEETADKVKAYLPQIRNHILLLLSSKTAEDLGSADGKKKLIEEVLEATREPLGPHGENVQAVLLGSMLIQ